MTALPDLAQRDAEIQRILDDASIGHRTAARRINDHAVAALGVLGPITSEKSVRRYRSRRLTPEALTGPQPTSNRTAPRGSGGQWRPGIDIDPKQGGEFRTKPRVVITGHEAEPEEADLLSEFDLDPATWTVTAARKSTWQSPNGEWLEARRVSFRRRSETTLEVADIEAIMARYPAPAWHYASAQTRKRDRMLMIPSGDLQLGKSSGGGTAATIERFCRITNDIADNLTAFAEMHDQSVILPWLGDCIEGIVSQRGRLIATLDMPITEQVRVYRRLMMHQIGVLAPLAVKVLIPVIPGNHDETTREQEMPVHDSWAIEGASAVADWMTGRPEYDHVEFVFPEPGELGITVNVGTDKHPYHLAFTHGHVAANANGIIPWWKGQAYGRQHAGQADMLVTAHFHHLRVEHTGTDRTWLQIPALDGGSPWYSSRSGEVAPTGLVSVEITPGQGQGWRALTVHS